MAIIRFEDLPFLNEGTVDSSVRSFGGVSVGDVVTFKNRTLNGSVVNDYTPAQSFEAIKCASAIGARVVFFDGPQGKNVKFVEKSIYEFNMEEAVRSRRLGKSIHSPDLSSNMEPIVHTERRQYYEIDPGLRLKNVYGYLMIDFDTNTAIEFAPTPDRTPAQIEETLRQLKKSIDKAKAFIEHKEPSVSDRAVEFLCSADVCASSMCMFKTLYGHPDAGTNHPRHVLDLGMCIRLLQRIPELKAELDTMREVSPLWRVLVDNWETLDEYYTAHLEFPEDVLQRYIDDLLNQVKRKP